MVLSHGTHIGLVIQINLHHDILREWIATLHIVRF
jgi:hypothetical protein